MRTFFTLASGWLIGGALIVGLASGDTRKTERRMVVKKTVTVTIPASEIQASEILIPVLGITADQLRDTYDEARGTGRIHRAMDILAPKGTPVIASVDGTIRKLFNSRAGGLTIYQFDRDEAKVYYYAHLDRYADGIAEGQFVTQGTVIGYVGVTGNAPAGTPHLHFSIENLPPTKEWWKGEPVNPYPILTTAASARR